MCGRGHTSLGRTLTVGVSLLQRPTQAYKGNENVLLTGSSARDKIRGSIGYGRNRSLRRMCAKEGHTSI